MTDDWQPKRPDPASDSNRDSVTRQTLRAGIRIRAPPPENPYLRIGAWKMGGGMADPGLVRPSSLQSSQPTFMPTPKAVAFT